MSKYESMSDFEINKLVAEARGYKTSAQPVNCVGVRCNNSVTKSYCNSWADMGPIISEHKINLNYEGGFRYEWETMHFKHLDNYDVECIGMIEHKNPLRAAAITFLIMMEGAQ